MFLIWPRKSVAKIKLCKKSITVAFRLSSPPVLWRFDLDKNPGFTLGLWGRSGRFDLGIRHAGGGFEHIASFLNYTDASNSFNAVQKALLWKSSWLTRFLITLVVVAGILAGGYYGFRFWVMNYFSATSLSQTFTMPKKTLAIPQSADDVLRPPL